jgi:3-phenylpropionate/cinnamic acid dioxygenase small subunit
LHGELTRNVEQCRYRKAQLLDERHFQDGLEPFTGDACYWMGGRSKHGEERQHLLLSPAVPLKPLLKNGHENLTAGDCKEWPLSPDEARRRYIA